MKAKIDGSICTGCAVCSDTCPEVFELGDDSIAHVKVEEVPAGCEDQVRDAAASCPVSCIEVQE